MSRNYLIKFQPRDRELLAALDYSPFDARQLAELSCTFTHPFTDEKYVRRRMNRLAAAGLVAHFQYQTESVGAMKYYKLTRDGYRWLAGPGKPLPRRSYFSAVSPSLQNHTRRLADFIVKTLTAAKRSSAKVLSFHGENRLELTLGKRSLRLDAAAQFKLKGYRPYSCLFELDCGTEPVFSSQQRESLAQKVRFVCDFKRSNSTPFRHYMIFATPASRLENYMDLVADANPQAHRSIFFATTFEMYLTADDPLGQPIFIDQNRNRCSILPLRSLEGALQTPFAAVTDTCVVA